MCIRDSYKIEHDPKAHKRSFLKIIDGSLRLRDVVRINDSEKFIKIKNLKTIYQGLSLIHISSGG